MVHIPTTERQYYNNTRKVNTLETFAKAMQPAAENLQKTLVDQQKIRMDANATKGRAEADELVRQLQLEYQRTPNSAEYKAKLHDGLNEIWKRYGQDIDPLMQGQWSQMTNKLNIAYDDASNQWAYKQRQENAKFDLAEGMNANYNLAYSHGQNNNTAAALLDLDYSYEQMRANIAQSLGEVEADKLLKNYKKQYVKSFIDGQLQTNPEGALQALNNKEVAGVFDGQREVDQMKEYAVSKLDNLKKQAKYKNIIAGIQQGNGLLNASMNKNLSLEEINSLMPENATDDYKSLIYSLNGYTRKKGGKGGSGKLSDDEKAIEAADIYEQMSMLLSNKKNATVDDYQTFQNNVYKAMNNKSIAKEDGMKIINQIMEPYASKWKDKTEEANSGGIFGEDVGAEAVIDTLKSKKIINKEDTEIEGQKKMTAALNAGNNALKVKAYQLFYGNLQNLVDQSGGKYETIDDVYNAPRVDKREILQKAQNMTLQNMAQDQFSYLANLKQEEQPNKVLKDSGMTPNTNNVENSKKGTPIKQNEYKRLAYDRATGKYGVELSNGTIKEISRDLYLQLGGKY